MGANPSLSGKRIFVVEDEALSAIYATDVLEELDCVVAGVAASNKDAKSAIRTIRNIDCVMLDVMLQDNVASDIAALLIENGTPFVVCSGNGIALSNFPDIPVVAKPYTPPQLRDALTRALSGCTSPARGP